MRKTDLCGLVLLAACPLGTANLGVSSKEDAPAIRWEVSLKEALKKAQAENRPILVAINMDGEVANEELASRTYLDRKLVDLASKTVNLIGSAGTHSQVLVSLGDATKKKACSRFKSVTCEEHQAVEKAVRRQYFKNSDEMVAPQHLTLKPNGQLIDLRRYQVSAQELEKMISAAIQVVGRPRKQAAALPQKGTKKS